MKKYKLIKEYSGSPILNSIAYDIGIRYNISRYLEPLECIDSTHRKNIENHPEYWEEVKDKGYRIIQFANIKNTLSYIYLEDRDYYTGQRSLEELLNDPRKLIYSIKRLSDGEIFNIDDKIEVFKSNGTGEFMSFKINGIFVDKKDSNTFILTNRTQRYITNDYPYEIRKAKQKLFVTEDGVEIFNGDAYYYINKSLKCSIEKVTNVQFDAGQHNMFVNFSTKERAKEYLGLHKKQYSKQDIINSISKTLTPKSIRAKYWEERILKNLNK